MPLIIYRYLILEILPPFGVSLLAFTSIVFLGRLMKITQMIVVKGVGLWEVLQTCLFLLPYLLVFTLPMAATVGILLSLTRLSVDQEVTALKTAGLSFSQLLPPILAFSVAMALLTLFLTVIGSPWGQTATRELLKNVAKKRADLGIQEQVFNTDFRGLMLFVNHVSSREGRLDGIFVYDFRDPDNPNTVYAHSGQLSFDESQESMLMQLSEGRVFRFGKEGKNQSHWQMLEFQSYQLPLQLFGFAAKGGKSETEMSLRELWATLGKEAKNSDLYNRAMVELNQRFAMPVGALILCLIAMPLGLSHRQQGRTWGLIVGLALFLIYYIVFTASWRLALNFKVDAALAPWTSNILFLGLALFFWSRMVRELPLLPDSLKWRRWLHKFRGQGSGARG
ncbi:MAG: LPS export ABC transporter permease LptF [Deltaproteobacteria bacterium]|nr:LPS export ABC transporter permease LptF [Deltaproteobacteria bacterium]